MPLPLAQEQPADFAYTQLWASADGETHIAECTMKGFEMKKYADTEQFVRETDSPIKVRRALFAVEVRTSCTGLAGLSRHNSVLTNRVRWRDKWMRATIGVAS